MSIEIMKQALEALETLNSGGSYKTHNAATALRQAIEFEEMVKKGTKAWADTPDDWVDDLRGGIESCTKVGTKSGVLRTKWVGLTDEDIDLYAFDIGVTDNKAPAWLVTYARGIEAKLKEKNT
jgi:hypothetical protein